MSLANIEKIFMDNLLHPNNQDVDFLSNLLPLKKLSKEKQLNIYQSNINGAHQKVLEQVYPAILNILGDEYFSQLCKSYRFEHPSTDADLNGYGEYFSSFIAEQISIHKELNGFEYLASLAWLEWCWHSSYYANNDDGFSFEKLSLLNENEQNKIVLSLSNSFSLHSTNYPIVKIWQANISAVDCEQEFSTPEDKVYFCISRVELTPKLEFVDDKVYELLNLISKGLPLEKLMSASLNCAENTFQECLMLSIQNKWIVGFS